MKQPHFLLYLIILLVLVGCGPEWSFKQAEQDRSKASFEQFIEDYPDSELIVRARYRLSELTYWASVESTLTSVPYEAYLDSFPDGLFREEARALHQEVIDFEAAREQDLIEAYTIFESQYPESMFADSIAQRKKILPHAAEAFSALQRVTSPEALMIFLNDYGSTGYGKVIQTRLDSLVEASSSHFGQISLDYQMQSPPGAVMVGNPDGSIASFPTGTTLTLQLSSEYDENPVTTDLSVTYSKMQGNTALFQSPAGLSVLMDTRTGFVRPFVESSLDLSKLPTDSEDEWLLLRVWLSRHLDQ